MLRPTRLRAANRPEHVQSDSLSGFVLNNINPIIKSNPVVFKPYIHPDLYFRDLENHKIDTTKLRFLHSENPPSDPPVVIEKIILPIPKYPDTIPSRLEITKKNRVKVKLYPGMANLYEKYKKGHKASIEERVMACSDFGYPDYILKDMITKHEKTMKNATALEEFVKNIFGEISDKKQAIPKKKNIYQIFKIKNIVCARPEPEDEPNEEAEDVAE